MDRMKKVLSEILKAATSSVAAKLFGCWFLLIILLCIYWLGFGTPNDRTVRLGIDYLVTMPWYIIMLLLMLKVQKRYRYSIKEILFFGGVYEIGADGFIGSLFEGNLTRGFFVSILVLPLFVVVYKACCASFLLFHKA